MQMGGVNLITLARMIEAVEPLELAGKKFQVSITILDDIDRTVKYSFNSDGELKGDILS